MSIYAKIDENNIVINLIECEDADISTQNGKHVKVTQQTNNAVIGYEYVPEKNKFKSEQPFPSWTLDEETLLWNSPTPKPEGAEVGPTGIVLGYRWNENSQEWVEI